MLLRPVDLVIGPTVDVDTMHSPLYQIRVPGHAYSCVRLRDARRPP
jgi:hypothetical protein